MYIKRKEFFKRFAFLQKSEIKLLSASKGGIAGIFVLYGKQINMNQYVFGALLAYSSSEVILRI